MNEASANLCLQSPNLLSDRTLLLKECRSVVDEEGYDYKKGKSRSRLLNTSVASEPPKRKKITEEYRLSRIAELQERIKDITDRLGYKEKRRESASMVRNYKECDQITEQMSELKCERKRLDIELASLNKKQKKSKWYFNKKSSRSKSLPGSSSGSNSREQPRLDFFRTSSSCSSSHSISPSPLSHPSSGNSSPHGPLSPSSETENTTDAIVLSSEQEDEDLSAETSEPKSQHTEVNMSFPAPNESEASQSF